MIKPIKSVLYSLKYRVVKFLAMEMMPANSFFRLKYINKYYLSLSRIPQEDVKFDNSVAIESAPLVIYGSNVHIEGKGKWDARSGIIIGEGSKIGKGVNIKTREVNEGVTSYGPVVIAPNTIVSPNTNINPNTELGEFDLSLIKDKYQYGAGLFFVVSTGRSGSKAIAHLLNKHNEVQCYHDSIAHINAYACDKVYKSKTVQEISDKLQKVFVSLSLAKNITHGFSDQKLSLLIPEVHKIFPKAKFVWLIRKGDSFVNAAYSRGWYFNREFGYPANEKEFFKSQVIPSAMDAAHRTNAFKIGEKSEEEWIRMTAFERNCWYWTYLNAKVEVDLQKIPSAQWMQVRLHELDDKSTELQEFLGVDVKRLPAKKVNEASYKKISKSSWNEEMKNIFEAYCGKAMIDWF